MHWNLPLYQQAKVIRIGMNLWGKQGFYKWLREPIEELNWRSPIDCSYDQIKPILNREMRKRYVASEKHKA